MVKTKCFQKGFEVSSSTRYMFEHARASARANLVSRGRARIGPAEATRLAFLALTKRNAASGNKIVRELFLKV